MTSWSSKYKIYLNKQNTFQNKAVKISGGRRYYDRATQLHLKFGIPKSVDLAKI